MNFTEVGIMPEFEGGHFFNDPDFHELKEESGHFFVYRNDDNSLLARCSVYINDNTAISGYNAPFGSIEYSTRCTDKEIQNFISGIINTLHDRSVQKVIIKHYPDCYAGSKAVEVSMLEAGFTIDSAELNQHLIVDKTRYKNRISQKERNKLNRAEIEGFEFSILNHEHLPEVYGLISATHERKGFPVTMSLMEMQNAFKKSPDRYVLFGLFDKDILIAAVASVQISSKILYNFFHADLEDYRKRSPLVMLIGEVYKYCFEQNIEILDLGISSVNGVKNDGLFQFKKNLGCELSHKKNFVLEI